MYSLTDIKNGLREPRRILKEANRAYYSDFFTHSYNPRGIDIHSEDWDNLIILDACRVDAFRERALPQLPNGTFETRVSRASSTSEWLKANFSNRNLHDTVYVTGSSWILKIGDEIGADLHAVVDAKDDFDYEQDRQVEKAIQANEDYPDKRLLIHLIPPHHPFLGPMAEKHLPPPGEQGNAFFQRFRNGEFDININTLWEIYLENLDRGISAVQSLLKALPGKTIISADHAELLGDRIYPIPIRHWGHPSKLWADELVTVPWHIHDGERKDITAEPPAKKNIDSRSPDEIEEHLRSLGYKA